MKKIALAKDLEPLFLSTMHFLNRSDIAVHTAATSDDLLKFHFEHHAALIVTRLDLPGMHCETMVGIIRRSEVLKTVSILVLANHGAAPVAHRDVKGANLVLAMPADPVLLAPHVSQLLSVEPRRAYRVVLNAAAEGVHLNMPFLCNLENISTGGMLIRTTELLSPEKHTTCSFYLPDGSHVSAAGDIVRGPQRSPGSPFNLYGLRFVSLAPKAESAIAAFVRKESQ